MGKRGRPPLDPTAGAMTPAERKRKQRGKVDFRDTLIELGGQQRRVRWPPKSELHAYNQVLYAEGFKTIERANGETIPEPGIRTVPLGKVRRDDEADNEEEIARDTIDRKPPRDFAWSQKSGHWRWTRDGGRVRSTQRIIAPLFDARGDGIRPTVPAESLEELAARQGLTWLKTEPVAVRVLALKINNLGQRALETGFALDELEVMHNLVKHRKVRVTEALDLPPRLEWSPWLRKTIRRTQRRYSLIQRRSA